MGTNMCWPGLSPERPESPETELAALSLGNDAICPAKQHDASEAPDTSGHGPDGYAALSKWCTDDEKREIDELRGYSQSKLLDYIGVAKLHCLGRGAYARVYALPQHPHLVLRSERFDCDTELDACKLVPVAYSGAAKIKVAQNTAFGVPLLAVIHRHCAKLRDRKTVTPDEAFSQQYKVKYTVLRRCNGQIPRSHRWDVSPFGTPMMKINRTHVIAIAGQPQAFFDQACAGFRDGREAGYDFDTQNRANFMINFEKPSRVEFVDLYYFEHLDERSIKEKYHGDASYIRGTAHDFLARLLGFSHTVHLNSMLTDPHAHGLTRAVIDKLLEKWEAAAQSSGIAWNRSALTYRADYAETRFVSV